MAEERRPTVCVVTPQRDVLSETFIRAHIELLPLPVYPLYGGYPFLSDAEGRWLARPSPAYRLRQRAAHLLRRDSDAVRTAAHLKRHQVSVVLAEYGPTGALMLPACRLANLPMVVHFHGYDATQKECLAEFGAAYREMFAYVSRIVCVSHQMHRHLVALGAPEEKLLLSPYGVDASTFADAVPENAPPVFIGVGRFVEKKAPYLTILAFSKVVSAVPEARLVLIGDGPLLGPCRRLVDALHLGDTVELPGARPHAEVADRMRTARAFVQHSLQAANGDCEGTPVAILEAGASGLPVVSTRHAGIPDVIVEGQTGFLTNEGDADGMADGMIRLARDPSLAGTLGRAARQRIATLYTLQDSLRRLANALAEAAATR
ncbi:MAG: glycosyltransferase [Capsulimonadales bacterium]|nr:glycosyltransferase [Capsulimonadales bacterium]